MAKSTQAAQAAKKAADVADDSTEAKPAEDATTTAAETPAEVPAGEQPTTDDEAAAAAEAEAAALAEQEALGAELAAAIDAAAEQAQQEAAEEAAKKAISDPDTAALEPPAPRTHEDDAEEKIGITTAEASIARLRVTERTYYISAEDADLPEDAEDLFSPADAAGQRMSLFRLLKHGTATDHDRPVTVLLLAKGKPVHKFHAAELIELIARQQATEAAEADGE